MCIDNYENMLAIIVDKINMAKLSHKNSIIIGDNSSGKSEILKKLVNINNSRYYFIDTINRTFDVEKIFNSATELQNYNNVLCDSHENVSIYRIQEDIFNLKDSFSMYGKGAGGYIESIFIKHFDELKELVEEFLEIKIEIKKVKFGIFSEKDILVIDEEIQNLSNGYQAIIRLFLEILYVKNNNDKNNITIVIDEIDEFLSPKNKAKILPFITKKFPEFSWIVTTHSANVISNAKDYNLIILKENNYEFLDSNDFITITDVQEVFKALYDKKRNDEKCNIDSVLRRLLSFKITDKWSEVEEQDLQKIKKHKLSNSQRLILHQIINW